MFKYLTLKRDPGHDHRVTGLANGGEAAWRDLR
jgi:hypothetical protein